MSGYLYFYCRRRGLIGLVFLTADRRVHGLILVYFTERGTGGGGAGGGPWCMCYNVKNIGERKRRIKLSVKSLFSSFDVLMSLETLDDFDRMSGFETVTTRSRKCSIPL